MNMLYYFVVELPKKFRDEIDFADTTLKIETKFNEFEHRVNEGEVKHIPLKFNTPVKPGDTLYFHHNVVINGGMPFADYKDHYVVSFDPKVAVNSHAYAYKPQGTDELIPLEGWSILEESFEKEVEEAMFDVVEFKKKPRTTGVVAAMSDQIEELGLSVGDTVGFKENRDYEFKANDKVYFRTRVEDLLYAI